jgi:hypothetical protein
VKLTGHVRSKVFFQSYDAEPTFEMCICVNQLAKCGCLDDEAKVKCDDDGTDKCKKTTVTKLVHKLCNDCTEGLRDTNITLMKIEVDMKNARETIANLDIPYGNGYIEKVFEMLQQFDNCIESLNAMFAKANKDLEEFKEFKEFKE